MMQQVRSKAEAFKLPLDTTNEIFPTLKVLNKLDKGPVMTIEKATRCHDNTFLVEGHVIAFSDERTGRQHNTIPYYAAHFGVTVDELNRGVHRPYTRSIN